MLLAQVEAREDPTLVGLEVYRESGGQNALKRSNKDGFKNVERSRIDIRVWSSNHSNGFACKECKVLCLRVVDHLLYNNIRYQIRCSK